MSRVAKSPISIPASVQAKVEGQALTLEGKVSKVEYKINENVSVTIADGKISFLPANNASSSWAHAGTARAIVNNLVQGVSKGFERKLLLNGVGYKAQAKGNVLNLSLGYSHPVEHCVPEGVVVETPSQTEIVLKGIDKRLLGQVASDIRAYRPPEPYKGKGVRYSDEIVRRKEAKKK
ncbi:MAG: 50S ribosomal protein L6 [Candidatus Berkiella sp.]